VIQVKNIVKSFEGVDVLKDISADFRDGEVNMIIGQSGSGKTVLMKTMLGLFKPDSGTILIGRCADDAQTEAQADNRSDITKFNEKQMRAYHREVGTLFQGAALFDSMSVLQNVLFPLEMFSQMSDAEMQERAIFCLKRVNMPEHTYHLMPSEISGGQQKRVAIARAIVLNPKYLFCDEPNSGLDPKTSLIIDQLIQDITREYNICTIVNSHDMNSIMEIGDNILFLKNGLKEWQGSRHEICRSENEALNDFVFASELFKQIKEAGVRNNE